MSSVVTTRTESRERSTLRIVARNTTLMLGGQVLMKILAFVFNVYVVRRLGATHYGRYSAALAYVAIFSMLTDLGTSSLSVREMAREKENTTWMVPDIVALRVFVSLMAIACLPVSAWLLGKTPDMVLGIFIASCRLVLYAFQGPLDGVLIARERLDFSSAFKLLNQTVYMILGAVLLLVGVGYVGLLLASVVGVLVMGLASAYAVRQMLRSRFERPNPLHWWSLLRASFPFGVKAIANEFARRFDTVFMSFVLTDTAVGWYNVPYNLILMTMMMATSLALSMYPTLVREYDSGRGSIGGIVQRALRYMLLLSLPLAVGGMLLASRIIILLYGQEFAPAISVMQVLVWTLPSMFLAQILGYTTSAMHLERKAARVGVVNALINAALNVALVPRWGIVGAAIAIVVARLVAIAQLCWIIGPATVLKENVIPLLRIVGAGALMGGVVWQLRKASFLLTLDDKVALLLLIGTGAVVYGTMVLLLGAITPNESRYVYNAARQRLRRLRNCK